MGYGWMASMQPQRRSAGDAVIGAGRRTPPVSSWPWIPAPRAGAVPTSDTGAGMEPGPDIQTAAREVAMTSPLIAKFVSDR